MKSFFYSFVFFFHLTHLYGQGVDFVNISLQEAIEKNKNSRKWVFVDAYTNWCEPCKRMDREVFSVDSVGKFINENFTALKINMEKEEGIEFKKKYRVRSYPSFFYLAQMEQ